MKNEMNGKLLRALIGMLDKTQEEIDHATDVEEDCGDCSGNCSCCHCRGEKSDEDILSQISKNIFCLDEEEEEEEEDWDEEEEEEESNCNGDCLNCNRTIKITEEQQGVTVTTLRDCEGELLYGYGYSDETPDDPDAFVREVMKREIEREV